MSIPTKSPVRTPVDILAICTARARSGSGHVGYLHHAHNLIGIGENSFACHGAVLRRYCQNKGSLDYMHASASYSGWTCVGCDALLDKLHAFVKISHLRLVVFHNSLNLLAIQRVVDGTGYPSRCRGKTTCNGNTQTNRSDDQRGSHCERC